MVAGVVPKGWFLVSVLACGLVDEVVHFAMTLPKLIQLSRQLYSGQAELLSLVYPLLRLPPSLHMSCLSDGAAPMASESGGRDNQLPQGLMGTQYLGLLSSMAVYLPANPCTRLFSPISFFLSAGSMAFQLSASLRADKSWPTVPRAWFFSAVGPSAIGKQLKEKKSWTQLEGLAT
ncbi:hypothetical protein G5714_006653 [Onychostoma macrolepis]|uniref:Uncharacterized protein n=1 Tax=Onychostoma macrolepis TaxID=369639 RepID=A0A7J6CWY2_9TELE|nr:hypothetical protein G5714_006653 [Onychostoma macrolepis]